MRTVEDLSGFLVVAYGVGLSLANTLDHADSGVLTWFVTMGAGLWIICENRMKKKGD